MPFSSLILWADDSTLHVLVAAGVSVLLALLVHRISAQLVLRLTRSLPISNRTAQQCQTPALLLMPLIALQAVWQVAPDTFPLIAGVRHANVLLLLVGLTWLGWACSALSCSSRVTRSGSAKSARVRTTLAW